MQAIELFKSDPNENLVKTATIKLIWAGSSKFLTIMYYVGVNCDTSFLLMIHRFFLINNKFFSLVVTLFPCIYRLMCVYGTFIIL